MTTENTNDEFMFGLDTSALAETAPILPPGYYAAQITNAGVRFGETEKYSINIRKVMKYEKGNSTGIDTGEVEIAGNFNYGVTLLSKRATRILMRENPTFFGGRIRYPVDSKSFKALGSHVLGNFLAALQLKDVNYNELTGFTYDPSLDLEAFVLKEFPDEGEQKQKDDNADLRDRVLAHPEGIKIANALLFHREYLQAIGSTVNGSLCRVNIIQQPNYKNPEVRENAIELGTWAAPFCGIIAYKDGCEEDLED